MIIVNLSVGIANEPDVKTRDQIKREADVLMFILKRFGYEISSIELTGNNEPASPHKITDTNVTFRKAFI